jgi:murein DD-endopeptidase MepM/ murein hydrolase activator NlpD
MDKKNRNKATHFFKKEGFYLSLFVCLCIVATMAAVATRNFKNVKTKAPVAISKDNNDNKKTKPVDNNTVEVPSNATQVKETGGGDKTKTAENSIPAKTDTAPAVPTAAKPALSFTKPVVGTLLLGFSDLANIEPTDSKTIQSVETVNGMYINCKIGQDVFASESGTVVENTTATNYGVVVTIKHANGYKTVYGNLADNAIVKVGSKVTRGQKIGVVGNTSNHFPTYKALSDGFIFFQVLKNEVPTDPVTCNIKY